MWQADRAVSVGITEIQHGPFRKQTRPDQTRYKPDTPAMCTYSQTHANRVWKIIKWVQNQNWRIIHLLTIWTGHHSLYPCTLLNNIQYQTYAKNCLFWCLSISWSSNNVMKITLIKIATVERTHAVPSIVLLSQNLLKCMITWHNILYSVHPMVFCMMKGSVCVCVCFCVLRYWYRQACVLDCHYMTLLWYELITEHFCQWTKQKPVLSLILHTCSLIWPASEH